MFAELGWNPDFWNHKLLSLFIILLSFVALAQCFTGSDVLRWRSFYESHHNAWKSHYSQVFDNGLRETLCCLGRLKYLTSLQQEEDEVSSVARLLGDLVAYRASGTGHMELLTGFFKFHFLNHFAFYHHNADFTNLNFFSSSFSFTPKQ